MRTNEKGKALIREYEGLKLESYRCPAGKWSIGYGHSGGLVGPSQVISQEEAEALLDADLLSFELGVEKLVAVGLNSNQFSALVSFAYNCGLGNLERSTLLKKVNAGEWEVAAKEFLRWNKAGGKILPGLTRRRQAEACLFRGQNTGISNQNLDG